MKPIYTAPLLFFFVACAALKEEPKAGTNLPPKAGQTPTQNKANSRPAARNAASAPAKALGSKAPVVATAGAKKPQNPRPNPAVRPQITETQTTKKSTYGEMAPVAAPDSELKSH
jgi:hypothetical protein